MHYGIIHSNTNEILSAVSLPFINNCFVPKKYIKAIPGDLFLADTSEDRKDCGKGIEINGLTNHAVVGGLHTMHIRDKHSLFVPFYKALFTRSNTFHKFAYKYSEGIKVFSLKPSLFKYLDFYYPEKLEQQKIVDLFEYIDTKIALLEKKIEALKKYRKGIQKVAFRRTPNKAYVKLKSLVSFMPKSKLSAGNSIENGKYPFYLSGEKIGAINSFMYEGCYIIANDGGEAGFRLSNGPFAYSDHCICFQNANEWTTRNVYEYLDSQKNKITYVGFLGSGLKNIDRSYLQNFKIPLSIENKQLAIMFSLFDERIRHLENELLRLKATKRYLLANMFI